MSTSLNFLILKKNMLATSVLCECNKVVNKTKKLLTPSVRIDQFSTKCVAGHSLRCSRKAGGWHPNKMPKISAIDPRRMLRFTLMQPY